MHVGLLDTFGYTTNQKIKSILPARKYNIHCSRAHVFNKICIKVDVNYILEASIFMLVSTEAIYILENIKYLTTTMITTILVRSVVWDRRFLVMTIFLAY